MLGPKLKKKQWETVAVNVLQVVVASYMVFDYHEEINKPGRRTDAAASSL